MPDGPECHPRSSTQQKPLESIPRPCPPHRSRASIPRSRASIPHLQPCTPTNPGFRQSGGTSGTGRDGVTTCDSARCGNCPTVPPILYFFLYIECFNRRKSSICFLAVARSRRPWENRAPSPQSIRRVPRARIRRVVQCHAQYDPVATRTRAHKRHRDHCQQEKYAHRARPVYARSLTFTRSGASSNPSASGNGGIMIAVTAASIRAMV